MDQDDGAIVWSESDTTAAFCCFLFEPSWYPFQAISKLVSGSLAASFDPSLDSEPVVYPAQQHWTPAEKYGTTCRCHERWTKADRISSLFTWTVSAKRNSCASRTESASAAEVPEATAAVPAAWANWEIPRQLIKQDEIDVLVARVSGTLGRISLPRRVVGQLIGLSSWCCQDEPRTIVQGQIAGGRWVRAFQFRRELTSFFTSFGDWIRPEGLRAHRRLLPESMIDDVLLAILSVPVCVSPICAPRSARLWWRQMPLSADWEFHVHLR